MVERYEQEEIVSVLTGYQRFFAKGSSKFKVYNKRLPFSERFRMYNIAYSTGAIEPRDAVYIGNHVAAYYYPERNVGTITPRQEKALTNFFVGKYPAKAARNLQKMVGDVQNKNFDSVGVQNVPAGEEQMATFDSSVSGAYNVPLKRTPGQAQPVDIRGDFKAAGRFKDTSGFQVTVSRLDQAGHHGIYGAGGMELSKQIQEIRMEGGADQHDKIAKAGLRYFKGRLPQWNAALARIQKHDRKRGIRNRTTAGLRSKIAGLTADGGGISIGQAQEHFKDMMASSTGFFGGSAAQITQTALGNADFFTGTGVSYTFTIDPYAHAVLQNFRMHRRGGGKIRWDEGALKHAFAVKGLMATDEYFKLTGAVQRQNDAGVKRVHAQTMTRANRNAHTTQIGVSQSANLGDLRTRSGRFYSTIDLYHADKDMSHLIKKELIPFFRKEYAKDIKTFTKQYIGTPERIEAGFSTPMFKAWAAPYLALTDYSYEAFGVQNPMGVNY